MIKTPVKRCIVSDNIVDSQGNWIAKLYDLGADADEVVKRINMHDELVKSLRDMFELAGKAYFDREWKDRYEQVELLLERCK